MVSTPTPAPKHHVVDAFDGTLGRFLACDRCGQRRHESRFGWAGAVRRSPTRAATLLDRVCKDCKRKDKGKWASHPGYSPALEDFWVKTFNGLKSGAKARALSVSITVEDVLGLYLQQGGLCALSGLKMNPFSAKKYNKPSVDRIDSLRPYTLDNIQIVLVAVNQAKNNLPNDVFIELCGAIAAHNNQF